jgi:hypothetical protein
MPDPRQIDYSEPIVYLDQKFSAVDGQFEGLKDRVQQPPDLG